MSDRFMRLDGFVRVPANVEHEIFDTAVVEWVEGRGWGFTGVTAEATEEELLGLTPDPSILSGGVTLSEEEKAIVATVRRVVGEAGYPNLAEELEETITRLTGGGA